MNKFLIIGITITVVVFTGVVVWPKFFSQERDLSGIRGVVLLGPICPVERIPPEPQCAPKPYQTKLVITTKDQSQVIKEFNSDADGKFYVEVPPGDYAIRSAAASNLRPYCGHDAFKVEAGTFTDITVSCDTGIR